MRYCCPLNDIGLIGICIYVQDCIGHKNLVFISRKYQGNGLFRKIMSIGMELLSGKYSQFILRACSDNGFLRTSWLKYTGNMVLFLTRRLMMVLSCI